MLFLISFLLKLPPRRLLFGGLLEHVNSSGPSILGDLLGGVPDVGKLLSDGDLVLAPLDFEGAVVSEAIN